MTISFISGPPAWALLSKQNILPKHPFHLPPNLQALEESPLAQAMRIVRNASLVEAMSHDKTPGLSGAATANMPRRIP